MQCSFCSIPLDKLNIGTQEKIYIWNCRKCHSTFFPMDSFKVVLHTIIYDSNNLNSDVYRLILSSPKQVNRDTTLSHPSCPECQKVMKKEFYKSTDITIYKCKEHGIWVGHYILNQIHKHLISTKEKLSVPSTKQSQNIENREQEHMGFLAYLFWMTICFIPLLWGIDLIEYTSDLYKNVNDIDEDSAGQLYFSAYLLMIPFIVVVLNFLNKLFGIFALFMKIKREFTNNIPSEIITIIFKGVLAIIGLTFLNACYDGHDNIERDDFMTLFILGVFLILPLLEILLNILFARIYEIIKK